MIKRVENTYKYCYIGFPGAADLLGDLWIRNIQKPFRPLTKIDRTFFSPADEAVLLAYLRLTSPDKPKGAFLSPIWGIGSPEPFKSMRGMLAIRMNISSGSMYVRCAVTFGVILVVLSMAQWSRFLRWACIDMEPGRKRRRLCKTV